MIDWLRRLLGLSTVTTPPVAENGEMLDRLRHACAREVVDHHSTAHGPPTAPSGPSLDEIEDERISHDTFPEFSLDTKLRIEKSMPSQLKAIALDVDPETIKSLRQAFPEWRIAPTNEATLGSLSREWNPGGRTC